MGAFCVHAAPASVRLTMTPLTLLRARLMSASGPLLPCSPAPCHAQGKATGRSPKHNQKLVERLLEFLAAAGQAVFRGVSPGMY